MQTEVLYTWHIKQSGVTFVQHPTGQSCLSLMLRQTGGTSSNTLYSLQTSPMLNPTVILEWFQSVRSSHMTVAQCSGRTTSFGKPRHCFLAYGLKVSNSGEVPASQGQCVSNAYPVTYVYFSVATFRALTALPVHVNF